MKEVIFELGLEKSKILVIGRNGEKGALHPRMIKQCEHNPRSVDTHVFKEQRSQVPW